jgi:hypothetical protein
MLEIAYINHINNVMGCFELSESVSRVLNWGKSSSSKRAERN